MLGVAMSKKKKFVSVLFLSVVVGGTLFFAIHQHSLQPVAIGDTAPDFTLPTLIADPTSVRDFRGHVVVVNFWATWCPPCVEEVPGLEKFAEQMRDQGVKVLGVSVDRDDETLRRFVAQYRMSFTIARDPEQAVAGRYGTFQFPESYILDRDGRVAEKLIGAVDWQDPRLISFVQELARGRAD
jgi:cytochrome c biogenesis protein CcmG, thiol:disulfide interchange protein DsbE